MVIWRARSNQAGETREGRVLKTLMTLLVVSALTLAGCATGQFSSDCQARRKKAERVAALADTRLTPGLTTLEVRAILGQEPDEILTIRGTEPLETWRYFLLADCKARLGMTAPTTELLFLNGKLLKWKSFGQ
jgi:hypothetical protein